MRLFKLRPLDGEGLFYALDMILNERIYLSTCEYMNDINEGIWEFSSGFDKEHRRIALELQELINRHRFSCFLNDIENQLMWAHYAGGFSGIAFNYEVDDTLFDVREIDYIGVPKISLSQAESVLKGEHHPQDVGLLKQKEEYWKYEKEWRLYNNNENNYINNIKPISIIFGAKNIKYSDVLIKIAKKYNIQVGYMVPETSSKFVVEYD